MFLINRGKLFSLLGRVEEARSLLSEGIKRVEGTSRETSAAGARKELEFLDLWQRENPQCQLDWRWFSTYQQLASYSDVRMLAQAGPFNETEQQEWEVLWPNREDESVSDRLAAIVNLSRRRELDSCFQEQRNPRFHYPLVPYEEVLARIAALSRLCSDIEQQERNVIVRRLYQ